MPENDRHHQEPPPLKQAPKFKFLKKAFGQGQAQMTAQASAVGISFAVAIVLGLALGWWLDKKLGTAPWLLLGGLFLGIGAGFKNLFTVSARLERMQQKLDEEKNAAGRPGCRPKTTTTEDE